MATLKGTVGELVVGHKVELDVTPGISGSRNDKVYRAGCECGAWSSDTYRTPGGVLGEHLRHAQEMVDAGAEVVHG